MFISCIVCVHCLQQEDTDTKMHPQLYQFQTSNDKMVMRKVMPYKTITIAHGYYSSCKMKESAKRGLTVERLVQGS